MVPLPSLPTPTIIMQLLVPDLDAESTHDATASESCTPILVEGRKEKSLVYMPTPATHINRLVPAVAPGAGCSCVTTEMVKHELET